MNPMDQLSPEVLAAERWLAQGDDSRPCLGRVCDIDLIPSILTFSAATPTTTHAVREQPERRVKIFVSYAHEDAAYANRLTTSCAVLRREGWIDLWTDAAIAPGDQWHAEIDQALEAADVVVLLVSPDFLDSDFCYGIEMRRALERHARGEVAVVPVHIRWADVAGAPFERFQSLPARRRPVSAWPDQDAAWLNVVGGLRRLLQNLDTSAYEREGAR